MKKYAVPIITLFLLVLATGLYGQSDDQPRFNLTLFGDFLSAGKNFGGFGGALGYNLTSWVALEGEESLNFPYSIFIISGGVVLSNSDFKQRKLSPYVLGGAAYVGISGEGGGSGGMLGGGIKIRHKNELIRLDLRFYFFTGFIWKKFSIGWMWIFG